MRDNKLVCYTIGYLHKSTLILLDSKGGEKMVLLRLFLFGISTFGSFELIRKVCNDKVNIYFLPSLTIAIQVSILFLAGIFNLLPEATVGLYFIGFVSVIDYFYKNKNISFIKSYINIGYIVMLVLLLILAVYLKGKIFVQYDNFSHWAIVVRRMLEVNRYPNFDDTVIMFQEYPLGSATYIYFFTKLTCTSESVQMLAQSYMMLAAILPLYSFAKKNHGAVSIVIVSFVNYVFLYNILITDLLVDTLLPVVGVCGLLFTYLHCKDGEKINFYFSAFYMVEIIQIKNSGIFFVAFIAIQLFIFARKNKELLHGIICVGIPFLSLILWQKHCKYVFEFAETSKHAMTVKNYTSVFGGKSHEDIMKICSSLFKFAITYKETWITVGIAVIIGILTLLVNKGIKKSFFKVVVVSLVIYVVYQLGMLAMYLFSMPGEEATSLAAIERYTKTILIAIIYLNMISVVQLISKAAKKKILTIITTVCTFVTFFAVRYISSGSINSMKTVVQNEVVATERNWIEDACTEYAVPMHESYCILIPSEDFGYAYYLGKYIFQSTDIGTTVVQSEEQLNNVVAKYIFVYDQDNENVNNWIQKNYPEQLGNKVIIQTVE